MVVIPFARGRRRAKHTCVSPLSRTAAMRGSFQAPSGRAGTMTGWMRLRRFVLESGRLRALAVFTGELFDVDGSRVGIGSRRMLVPVEMVRSKRGISVSIGPLDVDLMGLAVSVEAFSMELGTAGPVQGSRDGRRLESVTS